MHKARDLAAQHIAKIKLFAVNYNLPHLPTTTVSAFSVHITSAFQKI